MFGLRERSSWFENVGRSGGIVYAGSFKRRYEVGIEGVEREFRFFVIGAGLSMGF